MTKTLADMTAEERAACVGMWAATPGNELAVIASVSEPDVSRVFFPQSRGDGAALLNLFITPRFDLPRAWTPDGEPDFARALAEEEYQYGVTYTGVKHGGHHIEWVEATGNAELDRESLQLLVKHWKNAGQSPKVLRRRVFPPEAINE